MPRVCVELVRARKIFNKNVELAAREISRRMEELAQVNDQAWHLLSYLMLYLFPKGRGTEWGYGAEMGGEKQGGMTCMRFLCMAWTWELWWKTTKEACLVSNLS